MAQRRAIISRNWFWKKEISKHFSKKIFRQSLYNFSLQLTKGIMSTNKSREILACRRQVLSREQREGERQRARVNTRRASVDDRQRQCVRSRRRQNFSEESRQVERVRGRRRRENYSEKRRQAERDRARMNRQRQREREIQRQRERQQNNDMMRESVVLMSLWPSAINILISNWSRTRKFSQSFKNTSREDRGFSLFSP